jgi:hypothetical protein
MDDGKKPAYTVDSMRPDVTLRIASFPGPEAPTLSGVVRSATAIRSASMAATGPTYAPTSNERVTWNCRSIWKTLSLDPPLT